MHLGNYRSPSAYSTSSHTLRYNGLQLFNSPPQCLDCGPISRDPRPWHCCGVRSEHCQSFRVSVQRYHLNSNSGWHVCTCEEEEGWKKGGFEITQKTNSMHAQIWTGKCICNRLTLQHFSIRSLCIRHTHICTEHAHYDYVLGLKRVPFTYT